VTTENEERGQDFQKSRTNGEMWKCLCAVGLGSHKGKKFYNDTKRWTKKSLRPLWYFVLLCESKLTS